MPSLRNSATVNGLFWVTLPSTSPSRIAFLIAVSTGPMLLPQNGFTCVDDFTLRRDKPESYAVATRNGKPAPAPRPDPGVVDHERLRARRQHSVDNLERLYTIVAALALTSAVERLIMDRGSATSGHFNVHSISVEYASVLMFLGLVATMIPFYHGANVYLFETHVHGDGVQRPLAVLLDFLFFFSQGLIFFLASRVIGDAELFYWVIVVVLLWDCVWEMSVYLSGESTFGQIQKWLYLNVVASMVLFVVLVTPLLPDGLSRWAFATAILVARSALDYVLNWSAYWPGELD